MEEIIELLIKLGLTLILSGIIGLEREVTGHKAGIRTLILVGIGAASFVMLADNISLSDSETGRIIAGVATGLGFLGAGAIIKEGINVKGLTTAASIWVTAAIGVSVGSGSYLIGIITFSFTIIVISLFAVLERKLNLKPDTGTIRVVMEKGYSLPRRELRKLQKDGVGIQRMKMENTREGLCFTLDVELPRRIKVSDFVERTSGIEGLREVEWEDTEQGGLRSYLDVF